MDGQVLAAIITAIFAVLMSLLNIIITLKDRKATLVVQNIASNRIKWIEDMRKIMQEFAEAYIKEDKEQLKIIRSKMDVYMKFDDESYEDLYLRIDECMKNQYTDSGYKGFMRECQNVLQRVWKRMKIETGMDIKDDLAIRKKVLGH